MVSGKPERWQEIESGFRNDPEVNLYRAESLVQADSVMSSNGFGMGDLVILDEMIDDRPAIDAAKNIILKNAFVYLAIVSDLPADQFHEIAEGLGILTQVPSRLSFEDAKMVMDKLVAINSIAKTVTT